MRASARRIKHAFKENMGTICALMFTLLLVELKVYSDDVSVKFTRSDVQPREREQLAMKYDSGALWELEPDPFFRKWSQHTCRACSMPDVSFIIVPKHKCHQNKLRVMFLINSFHQNYAKRKGIRETWGQRSLISDLNMDYVFIFGVNKNTRDNLLIQQEDEMFNDVVQADFVEQYTHLNIKTLTGLKWATRYCQQAQLIIKTDDDMFMNVYGLQSAVQAGKFSQENMIQGNCMSSGYPHRCPMSKWYAPFRFYPYRFYGHFCLGSAFIMTQESARKLYKATRKVPYFHVEDVYISALGGAAAGLSRRQYPGIQMREVPMATCAKNSTHIASLLSEPSSFYKLWQQMNMDSCVEQDAV